MRKRQVTDEAYFTSPKLASQCFDALAAQFDLESFELLVEPSAGDGVFLDLMPEDRRIGIDLHPRHPEIVQQDFLLWRPDFADGRVLVLGNPPFGQRAAIAVRFLEHAATFADVIALILPRSFNKDTFQRRVPAFFHLVYARDCDDYFLLGNKEHEVKTVFQVWERRDVRRVQISRPTEHPHFVMRHAHLSRTSSEALDRLREDFEFTLPQVGARFSPRDVRSVDRGSHWFIKPQVPGVREVFDRLDFGFLANMNVAHTSLSKADIVQAYETAIDSQDSSNSRWSQPAHGTGSGRDVTSALEDTLF